MKALEVASTASGSPAGMFVTKDLLVKHADATRFPHASVDYTATTYSASGTFGEGYRLRTRLDRGVLWAALIRKQIELPTENRYLIRQALPDGIPEVFYWNAQFPSAAGQPWPHGFTTPIGDTAMLLYDLILPGYSNLIANELPGPTPIEGPGSQPPPTSRLVEVTFNVLPPGSPLDRFRIWLHAGYWYDHRVQQHLAANVTRVVTASEWGEIAIPTGSVWHPDRRTYSTLASGLRTDLTTDGLSTATVPDSTFDPVNLGASW